MARKKTGDNKVSVEKVTRVSGKVTIAAGGVYEGYTVEQVSLLLKEITTKNGSIKGVDRWLYETKKPDRDPLCGGDFSFHLPPNASVIMNSGP